MAQYLPAIPECTQENVVIAPEFDVMKREPFHKSFIGYKQVNLARNLSIFSDASMFSK